MNNITTHTITTSSRRRLIAFAAILALGAGTDAAHAADAPASKPPTDDVAIHLSDVDRERMERQKPLIAAADVIQAAVDEDTRANPRSGYSSIALGDDSVVLRWMGALPQAVATAVDRAREDVAVEVVRARHTNAQLQAKAALVQKATKKHAGGAPFAVSIPIEGNEVRVEVEGDVITKVKNGLPELDLPIEVTSGDVPEPAGRLNDTPEFYGGIRIVNPQSNQGCTSGFAVRNWSGEFLVTAGHCGWPGAQFYNGNSSRLVGTANQEDVANDLLLIPTQNLSTASGRVFNNRWGASETTMAVNGWAHPYNGEYLCSSGSYTGEVCGVRVDTSSAYSYCGYASFNAYECYSGLYRASQNAGLRAVQPGDSGGPVYNYNRSAVGIISGGNSSGTTVIFQDFHTINQNWGVVPK